MPQNSNFFYLAFILKSYKTVWYRIVYLLLAQTNYILYYIINKLLNDIHETIVSISLTSGFTLARLTRLPRLGLRPRLHFRSTTNDVQLLSPMLFIVIDVYIVFSHIFLQCAYYYILQLEPGGYHRFEGEEIVTYVFKCITTRLLLYVIC